MSKYDARKEVFIKNYSKAHNISISQAREFYRKKYEPASDSQRRKIARNTTNKIKEQYQGRHPSQDKEEKSFRRPKVKTQKGRLIKKGQKKLIIRKERPLKDTKTFPRVKRASKKYVNASKYELQHGVNSKASQAYRVRHGRPRDYQ